MAASSSSSGLRRKYDVFINFRGEDTRRGFVSHLYKALRQKPINTFIDSEYLGKSDRLSKLLTGIRESRLSIVVFSQNYASSTRCLKELVEILECHHTKNQIVVPIFYEVDPSDIRKLEGSFAEAFANHEYFSKANMEEVRSWRSALARATDLSGWDSRNFKDEGKLIEEIVEDVSGKLIHMSSTSGIDNPLIEMDSHMHEMHLLLHPPGVETNNVRVVGIWGMGGLGKTTIARAVYDEIACQFEACCFLENVKEGFMKHGELHMQTQLLSSISGNKVGSSDISNKGFQVMLKSLGHRKVLVVADDVDKLAQIEALLGNQHSFGGGSRIIITTRDLQLLSGADVIYSPKILSDPGALELFGQYAFRTNQSTKDYDNLSRRAIKYAQGLPLALKVLGAFLYNKTIREWEDVLEKIRKNPQRGIYDVLKTSFDGLDDTEKDIFLDIACFFKGTKEDYATEILDSCGFYPHAGIRVLIDRALITVSGEGGLEMHDLLEEMGREIVRQESVKEPGRRSRLWSYEDVHHVLTQNTATKAVESIILDLSCSNWICLNAEAFVSMTQLRLLKITQNRYCKQHLIGHLKFLSPKLRCLSWHGFPLKSLLSNFQFKNLVELDMQYSLIDRLWEGTQMLEKLKLINLSYCQYLKETPDFTKMPNLEKLILQSCIRLVEIHPSILNLTNLVSLNLNGCKVLKIPASIKRMHSLTELDLSGCILLPASSYTPCWKYDVFINFRGEDTRRGFVSHLYKALRQKPINICINSEELRKGGRLSELLTAIRESRLSIVVFSENYASSTWCLKELVEILECRHTKNQIMVPIFYQVYPSDIRRLKGSFAEAFAKHERHSNVDVKEVQSWRSALARATDLSGWDSLNFEDDANLIEIIVEDVFTKLIYISSTSSKNHGLVEMDSHMDEMHLLLQTTGVETNDVRVVGIWGIGGLGKTTIARAFYNEIACRFEASCFLENVKEGFMKFGKLHMQTQLLSDISGNKVGSSDISNEGFEVMLKRHGQRKVLVVVDDVDKLAQIEALLGKQHSFGGGSRIIITTRDLQLLSGADATYRPNRFSDLGALELFERYALRTNQPTRDYDDLSMRIIQYAHGLPLALKVLGAFLVNKTVREWEELLQNLRKIPQCKIHDVLKTSFDGLDDTEKDIFLDIACFFKGMEKDHVIEILDSCGFYPRTAMRVLIDRALITVSWGGNLEMHDSLEEMGREIVRQESKEPGRRSRLWSYEDVHHLLTQKTATKAVESMILDLSNSDVVFLNTEAFVSMTKLRLLKISFNCYILKDKYFIKQHLIGHLKFLSRELRCLSWLGFPLKSLPSNLQFKNLVDLDMQYSLIDRLWEGTQTLEKLKFINLSYSQYLKETPDFTMVPNLEKLILQSCMSLIEVHPSILTLSNLVLLNLNGCKKLKISASSIRMKSLKTLDLSGCLEA